MMKLRYGMLLQQWWQSRSQVGRKRSWGCLWLFVFAWVSGAIVSASSVAGIIGGASTAYNASKGAVRILSKSIAVQYGPYGIRCNSVHPAPIETSMGRDAAPTPDIRAQRMAEIPLQRFGEPQEVANAILFLASDESSYVTGSELVVDGGLTAR